MKNKILTEENKINSEKIKESERLYYEITGDINYFSTSDSLLVHEENALKKHNIFNLIQEQLNFEKTLKKLKVFKIIQKKDKAKIKLDKLTNLRSTNVHKLFKYFIAFVR